MGNMSNPCINRWGLNTFWYRFWFSDTSYSNNLQQDQIFVKLLNIYFNYGIELPKSIFFSNYWFHKTLKPSQFPEYYRFSTFRNQTLGLHSSYRLRSGVTDVYPMRLWLFKYNNWVVINFYWFQPFKKRLSRKLGKSVKPRELFRLESRRSNSDLTSTRRLKTLLSLSMSTDYLTKLYYKF